jgi:MFS family permease
MPYRRGFVTFALFTLALINYVDRTTLSFAADPIAKEYGLDSVALGYLFSSFLWTYTLFLIPMGSLVDRFGAKRVAGFGIGIWSLATAATGIATNFAMLLGTRLVMGGGEAAVNPTGARVIREWIPASERGATNAMFNSGSYAGPALCALIAGPIIVAFGWRSLFFMAGSLGAVWLAFWLVFFTRPERAAWLSDAERAKIIAERSIAKAGDDGTPKAGLWGLLKSGPTLWGLALTQGCNTYSQYLFLTWLPSYLQKAKGLTIAKTGLYAAIPYAVAVVLCIVIGFASDRYLKGRVSSGKRRHFIAAAMVIAAVILFAPLVDSLAMIIVLVAISLTGIAVTTSLNFALVNDLLPNPKDIGVAMGFLVVGGNIFGLIAPIATGYVIRITGGFDGAFLIAGTLLVIGAVSVLVFGRKPIGGGSDPLRTAG